MYAIFFFKLNNSVEGLVGRNGNTAEAFQFPDDAWNEKIVNAIYLCCIKLKCLSFKCDFVNIKKKNCLCILVTLFKFFERLRHFQTWKLN